MNRLAGKVAVISGAARGQGEAEARRFVAEGAKVVLGDLRDELGEAVADELGAAAVYSHLDVRDPDDWARTVALATDTFGPVDVLVNNAGIFAVGKMTHEVSLDEYRNVVDVNQVGVFLGMRAVLPGMIELGRGSIVNISSTGGMSGHGGALAYNASKFAVRGMTKVAALEYGRIGIRVNSVHPGPVDTPMIAPENVEAFDPEEVAGTFASIAMPRAASPDEVANLVVFLASDEASFCTGAEYLVDGGLLAGATNPSARL